jgi:hypothetical protein
VKARRVDLQIDLQRLVFGESDAAHGHRPATARQEAVGSGRERVHRESPRAVGGFPTHEALDRRARRCAVGQIRGARIGLGDNRGPCERPVPAVYDPAAENPVGCLDSERHLCSPLRHLDLPMNLPSPIVKLRGHAKAARRDADEAETSIIVGLCFVDQPVILVQAHGTVCHTGPVLDQ